MHHVNRLIEDGDIGYAGSNHQSFVGQALSTLGGPPSIEGSATSKALVAFLKDRFKKRSVPMRAVSSEAVNQAREPFKRKRK